MLDLERINFLARKSKECELSKEELEEQKVLRRAYIENVLGRLKTQLDNTYIVDEKGNKVKVEKRNK